MMRNEAVIESMDETVRDVFNRRIEHEILRVLNGWGWRRMTAIELLFQLKLFTEDAVSELLLPVRMQKDDDEPPPPRPADVYLMRLPDSKAATKKAPYIIHQVITGSDSQQEGERERGIAAVRTIFCVYSEDEQAGGMLLLNLMEAATHRPPAPSRHRRPVPARPSEQF